MSSNQVHQSKSQHLQTSSSQSQVASRSASSVEPQHSPTQEEIENNAFTQDKFEAAGLQLKEKSGTITDVEKERLNILQAKMDSLWKRRMDSASSQPNLLKNPHQPFFNNSRHRSSRPCNPQVKHSATESSRRTRSRRSAPTHDEYAACHAS